MNSTMSVLLYVVCLCECKKVCVCAMFYKLCTKELKHIVEVEYVEEGYR